MNASGKELWPVFLKRPTIRPYGVQGTPPMTLVWTSSRSPIIGSSYGSLGSLYRFMGTSIHKMDIYVHYHSPARYFASCHWRPST